MDSEVQKKVKAEAERASWLIFRYIQNTLTSEEDEELSKWITQNEQNWKLFEEFTGEPFKRKLFRKNGS